MSTIAQVQNYKGSNSFILKMKDAISKYGSLTVNQKSAVEKILNAPVEAKQVELTDDMKKIQAYQGENSFVKEIQSKLEKYGKSELVSKEVKLDAAIVQAKKQTDPNWEKASKSMSRLRGPLEDETWPDYDIQLTEALNIACDWSIELNKTPSAKR